MADYPVLDGDGNTLVAAANTSGYTEQPDLRYTGKIDCSANPNFPAASAGQVYYVSVGGKIGGGSGTTVTAGNTITCLTTNDGGTLGAVGTDWNVNT